MLEPGDVVTNVAGAPRRRRRYDTITGAERGPTPPHLITSRRVGDEIDVGFVRAGALRTEKVTLKSPARPVPTVRRWDQSPPTPSWAVW